MHHPSRALLSYKKNSECRCKNYHTFARLSCLLVCECSYRIMLHKTPHSNRLLPSPSIKKPLLNCSQNRTHHSPACLHLAIVLSDYLEFKVFQKIILQLFPLTFAYTWQTKRLLSHNSMSKNTVKLLLNRSPVYLYQTSGNGSQWCEGDIDGDCRN